MTKTHETAEYRTHREACEAVKVRYVDAANKIRDKIRHGEELMESERHWVSWLIESASTQMQHNWFLLTTISLPEE